MGLQMILDAFVPTVATPLTLIGYHRTKKVHKGDLVLRIPPFFTEKIDGEFSLFFVKVSYFPANPLQA